MLNVWVSVYSGVARLPGLKMLNVIVAGKVAPGVFNVQVPALLSQLPDWQAQLLISTIPKAGRRKPPG